jgi:ferric-dicitrate binding protein FerR (iron transport regulator)
MKTKYMNTIDSMEEKIRNYFNGQLTDDEEIDLIAWMKSDESNKALFFRIKENLRPHEMEHPLLQSSYTELKGRLLINGQFHAQVFDRTRRFRISFSKIAAMLVVALITGFSIAYFLVGKYVPQEKIVWFETIVPRGEKSQLVLPDGSKVWVNSESRLSYPGNFMNGNRKLKLEGEAYFEVAKRDGEPLTVETKDYSVRVLGTKFNVMAYPDFNRTETSLVEGEIEIQKGEQTIPLVPGQILTFEENQFKIKEDNTRLTTRWKDDVFDFDKITFKELVIRLERWYNVKIEVTNPELNKIIYSGIFKNEETIWQVLQTFELTLPIRYKRVDFRRFIVEMKNNNLKNRK